MNQGNFEKWVDEKLIPNLPPNSVVVTDNAPYHSIQVDKPPTKYALNSDIKEWLRRKRVKFDEGLHKVDLYDLIVKHRPQEKTFRVDHRLSEYGHTVLRLPPYMCDLSPIELAWAKIKRQVRENNVAGDLSLTRLKELTKMALESLTKEDWEGYCRHVVTRENGYRYTHNMMPTIIDSVVISLGANEDSSSSSQHVEIHLQILLPHRLVEQKMSVQHQLQHQARKSGAHLLVVEN